MLRSSMTGLYLKNLSITGMLFNGRSFFMKYATNNSNSTVLITIFTMLFSTGLMSDAPYAAANSNVYMNMFFIS